MSDNFSSIPLQLLRCPLTGAALRRATAEEVARAGLAENSEALADVGGRYVYPVTDGIPLLRPDDAVANVK